MKCELCHQQGHERFFVDIKSHVQTFHNHELRNDEDEIRQVYLALKSILNDKLARRYFYISVIIGYAVSAIMVVMNPSTGIIH